MNTLQHALTHIVILCLLAAPLGADAATISGGGGGGGGGGSVADVTATGSLNALNAAVSIALAGEQGASVQFPAGTLAGATAVAQVSTDGGTTWSTAVFTDPISGVISTSLTNPSSAQYGILWPNGGASNVRVTLTAWTSGSVTANMRTTFGRPASVLYGSDGTNIRPLTEQTNGNLNVNMAQCTGCALTGTAVPTTGSYSAGNGSGNLTGFTVCDNKVVINLTANTQIITGTSSKQTYICSINIVNGAAVNVALVEGTGAVCATGIAGMAGGTTAATGWNFAANGGLTQGTGIGWIAKTTTAADNVCILVSAANQVSGVITYTQY